MDNNMNDRTEEAPSEHNRYQYKRSDRQIMTHEKRLGKRLQKWKERIENTPSWKIMTSEEKTSLTDAKTVKIEERMREKIERMREREKERERK